MQKPTEQRSCYSEQRCFRWLVVTRLSVCCWLRYAPRARVARCLFLRRRSELSLGITIDLVMQPYLTSLCGSSSDLLAHVFGAQGPKTQSHCRSQQYDFHWLVGTHILVRFSAASINLLCHGDCVRLQLIMWMWVENSLILLYVRLCQTCDAPGASRPIASQYWASEHSMACLRLQHCAYNVH